ncbi:hypothetical protein [Streptomyces dysideae]|uniref:Uncharacterized protein n=1 Tax=Streptomyces dysideae TaxID=909626 RepID=A0A101UZF9_9ACTN|nr:hypothetical protein [Streptomyces dysideae]KUO19725.1 hypothetical protein AQJ91_18060 [Streptomyces dysideae]
MSSVAHLIRRYAWLRVPVLLLALLVPGAHSGVPATPVAVAGEAVEYDALETDLRPPSRGAHRAAVPLRPAPLPESAPPAPAGRPPALPPRTPPALPAVRSVVLRC